MLADNRRCKIGKAPGLCFTIPFVTASSSGTAPEARMMTKTVTEKLLARAAGTKFSLAANRARMAVRSG